MTNADGYRLHECIIQSWVRKLPCGFASADGIVYFGEWFGMVRPGPLMADHCFAL